MSKTILKFILATLVTLLIVQGVCADEVCTADDQCNMGKVCIAGTCSACTADSQCGTGNMCFLGACTGRSCSDISECPYRQFCPASPGYCMIACGEPWPCPAGRICVYTNSQGGYCGAPPECTSNAECAIGQVCNSGACGACTTDSQCDTGQVCQSGTCTTQGTSCEGSIGDFVWHDLNRNGIQEAGEPGVNGASVTLKDLAGTTIAITTTGNGPMGQSGYYQFTGLCAGNYRVEATPPPGMGMILTTQSAPGSTPATDSNPVPAPVNLPTDMRSDQTIDFGYITPCTADDQCNMGKVCIAGACSACTADSQCGTGNMCFLGACTGRSCSDISECPYRQFCPASPGYCMIACGEPWPCPAGRVCIYTNSQGGYCGGCFADSQCTAGKVCIEGACVTAPPECTSNAECAVGQVCSSGACGACTADSQCDTGQVCQSGTCTTQGTPVPEFPSIILPAAVIIGILGAVLYIRRTREY